MAKYKIIPSSRTIVQSPISIGHKAEKGVEAIEFDLTAWVETYGSGTATIVMKRWGDSIPYPVALEIDENNKATWTLSDIDTAKAGMAYAQLSYIVGETVVKKSDIYTFRVMDSLTGEGDPPEAYESWLEHLTHFAAEAMAEVLDIEGIVTDKTLTVDGGIADAKAAGDALALKADKSTTYTKAEVDRMIEDVEVETDTTLEVAGAAADAAETGRQIGLIKADLNNIEKYTRVGQEYPFVVDGYINSSGGINQTTSAKNTGYISLIGVKSISYKVNLSSSAYGLAFFDSSKNFLQAISIAGGTSNTESTIEITETILQSATYFVVSHYYADFITWQPICKISSNDDTFYGKITALETESENTLKTSAITSYVGLNRFDANAVIVGKEVYGDGSLRDNANSAISDYIDITGGHFVYLKNLPTYTSDASRLAWFYDENKTTTGSRVSIARTATEANFAIPSNAKYFVFSVYQRANSQSLPIDYSNVMVTTEPTDESFVPYERFISSIRDYKIPSGGGGVDVSGLKVVIFGDSITETATMNDDGTGYTEGYRHNWPEYVNNYMKWGSFKNYAKSGASYKNRGSGYEYRQTVANQIALAMADSNNDDADIVIFSLGTNDGIANIGSYETAMAKTSLADLDQTNLYEALRYAYWTVRNKYKNAVCFSAIPIQRADIEPPTQLYEAIEKMAHRYGFIVINGAWQSGIVKENNVWNASGNDLYDGLHPNTTGQLKMAKLYASVMTSYYLWNVD